MTFDFSVVSHRPADDRVAGHLERFIQHVSELPLTDPLALSWFFMWLLEEARHSAFIQALRNRLDGGRDPT